MRKHTKWMISLMLTLVMLFSAIGTAAAAESVEPDDQSAIVTEEAEPDSQPVITEEGTESDRSEDQPDTEEETAPDDDPSADPAPGDHVHNWSASWSNDETYHWHECDAEDCPVTDNGQKDSYAEHSYDGDVCVECGYSKLSTPPVEMEEETEPEEMVDQIELIGPDGETNPDDEIELIELTEEIELIELTEEIELVGLNDQPDIVIEDVAAPTTYQEVYDRMIAFKTTLPEGMTWTNLTPYGTNGPLGPYYQWKGGKVYGASRAVGCSAFAFILSDAAFGSLPARPVSNGSFTFDDVKVGDILRVQGNSHSVIVLQKSSGGVIIAEGNYNKSVHWGRVMSEAEVMASSFIITRYPVGFVPSDDSEADKVAQSGTTGSLSWSLTNGGVLSISGSGAIPDFSPNDGILPPWNTLNVSTIVIKEGVTSIGNYAFYQSKALSVYIPDGVTNIGQSAFQESALVTVAIPGSAGTIENSAFRNCPNLTSVTVPEGVKVIGDNAFRGCEELGYIDFPASITSVGAGAFMDCTEITRVRFMPGSETVMIGDNLFSRCWNLTDVTLPEKADCISAGMFAGCISLTTLYIPAGVTEIKGLGTYSGSPFAQCTQLNTINFGGSEATWNAIGGRSALIYAGLTNQTTVNFNVKFDDPFDTDPNDPGDILPEDPDNPDNPDDDPSDDPAPSDHIHNWSTSWSNDAACHWHECNAEGCPATANSQKDGYAEHSYGSWVIDVNATASQSGSRHRDCTVCGYCQTESIPATDSPSIDTDNNSDNTDSSDNSGYTGSSNNSSSTPTHGPGGFTAAFIKDESIAAKTETTGKPDDSLNSIIAIAKQGDGAATNSFGDDRDVYYAPESDNAPDEVDTSGSTSEDITELPDRSDELSSKSSNQEVVAVSPQKKDENLSPVLPVLILTFMICGASIPMVHFIRKAPNKAKTDNSVTGGSSSRDK